MNELSAAGAAATYLSDSKSLKMQGIRGLSGFVGLARRSLYWLPMTCTLAGCLVAEPPTYDNPGRTPPFIDLRTADPSVTKITAVRFPETVIFSVEVRSEDEGVSLVGSLFRDYSFPSVAHISFGVAAASTFAEKNRKLFSSWTVPDPRELNGCHQFTMFVTHRDNLDFISTQEPTDRDDSAMATWWLNVNPGSETVKPDGGDDDLCPTTPTVP